MATVSVIMPAFNAVRFIEPAIDSVRRQTMSDFELIVVDDGSSDDTAATVQRIAAADPRVKLVRQSNAGPGPARNAGFRTGVGRFFAFLDSDDQWAPAFLETQVAILDSRPGIDVVFGNAWNRGGSRDGQPSRPIRAAGEPIGLAEILADEEALFIMVVFRREVVDSVGGFDPGLFTNEEYDLWIRAAMAGFVLARNPEPLGWYSCRPDSLSSSDLRMTEGILRVFEKTRRMLAPESPERRILERQVTRFEGELAAIRARASLSQGDYTAAARHLTELHARRGGWLLGLAARMPRAAVAIYRLRQYARAESPVLQRSDATGTSRMCGPDSSSERQAADLGAAAARRRPAC
jgi:GT2 family glycosyltransferase